LAFASRLKAAIAGRLDMSARGAGAFLEQPHATQKIPAKTKPRI
jgi:hypothetical protein